MSGAPPLRGAPFEAPLKDRGKQGEQNFFASWFHLGAQGGAVVRATETSAREIPPCAARRTQTVRKKRPGRSARDDTLRKAGATGPGALALLASRGEARLLQPEALQGYVYPALTGWANL